MRLVRLKVHAAAKKDRIEARAPDAFEAWVRAPAEAGRANEAVLMLLADKLGAERKRLRIVKGASSPSKLVQILRA